MKKHLVITFLISAICLQSQNAASVFEVESLVYFGIDFSHAKLVGDFGNGGGYEMKTKMFPAWNTVVTQEQEKFNFRRALRKKDIHYDIIPVSQKNHETDPDKIMSLNSDHVINDHTLAEMVSSYGESVKEDGIGLVFIVEQLNKTMEKAEVYVTFFDIKTKKIFLTEKMVGTPVGFGLRAYWANAFYSILKNINEFKYLQWKRKYAP